MCARERTLHENGWATDNDSCRDTMKGASLSARRHTVAARQQRARHGLHVGASGGDVLDVLCGTVERAASAKGFKGSYVDLFVLTSGSQVG